MKWKKEGDENHDINDPVRCMFVFKTRAMEREDSSAIQWYGSWSECCERHCKVTGRVRNDDGIIGPSLAVRIVQTESEH